MFIFKQFFTTSLSSPLTSLHIRIRYVSSAGSSEHLHGSCTTLPSATWLLPTHRYPGEKINDQLYNDILKEETLPFCISCHSYGHRTISCPTRPQVNQSFRRSPAQAQSLTASSTSSPTSTPKSSITTPPATLSASSPNLICRDFNRRFCRRVNCQFQHICSNQGCSGHPSQYPVP